MAHSFKPFAFFPWPVTIVTTIVYLAIVIPLLVVHNVVPSAPLTNPPGLDISEAWRDLEALSNGYHPFNSHRNDEVRQWLLGRIDRILATNGIDAKKQASGRQLPEVFVFDDLQSNLTYSSALAPSVGVYFESTNIVVYIRGFEDDPENWWETVDGSPRAGVGGVLVNAHYDSTSTGFGATDDGVGVVSCLQLVRYFTTPGNAPRKGLVVLFNNGEEDFLNGAHVFSQHPMSKFPHTFLNLEGAAAGGRAMLFRSTDTEVTRFYEKSPHPFGSVLAAFGFSVVRSQTDYVVFDEKLGMRGMDVAFYEHRERYHTDQDDARHTSKDSLWHMLSAAVTTTKGLVSDSGKRFTGAPRGEGKVPSGSGSGAVWFDLFGDTFVIFRLHTLFALSVTALVVTPLILLLTAVALVKVDKMYLFRFSVKLDGERVPLHGLHGFFRFPFLFAIPTGVVVGLAYLLTKFNPLIVHSSEYAVWSMMISAWVFLSWFVSCVADSWHPSALHRVYTLTWMFALGWILLVIATSFETQLQLGGVYFVFFYFTSVFCATWISYLELFSLPRKAEYAESTQEWRRASSRPSISADDEEESDERDAIEESPNETTSLLPESRRTTFAHYNRVAATAGGEEDEEIEAKDPNVYGQEQAWSSRMPQWTWMLQFLILAPFNIVILVSLALMITTALHKTAQDGMSSFPLYIMISIFTCLILSPLLPFIHRMTHHVPMFLLLVFIGTLVYNLDAFPFSASSRIKLYFAQEIDLDTGANTASLLGLAPFVGDATRWLPSTAGQKVSCVAGVRRACTCSWNGLAAHVVDHNSTDPSDWISFNVTRSEEGKKYHFQISGQNTRSCRIFFDKPVSDYFVIGSALDNLRFPRTLPESGGEELRLWSREWGHVWHVVVGSGSDAKLTGRVSCLWSDNNHDGIIPALDEVRRYAPVWAAVSKLADGLVEVSRRFEV